MSTEGIKHDAGKAPMDLLSGQMLYEVARVLEFGAAKYARNNWRRGFLYSRLISASMRHIHAFNDGQDSDPETGLSHIAHAICMLMFLLELHSRQDSELDDRYKHERIPSWLSSPQ